MLQKCFNASAHGQLPDLPVTRPSNIDTDYPMNISNVPKILHHLAIKDHLGIHE